MSLDRAPLVAPDVVVDDEPLPERGSTAGAWAAAAIVLAVGSLIFAVGAHLRETDLEQRVTELEVAAADRAALDASGSGARPPAVTTATVPVGGATTAPVGPPDPDAARAQVISAFGTAYDPARAIEERVTLVDDATGVREALASVAQGPNAVVAASIAVNVNDVQFRSPTRARVIYTITVGAGPPAIGIEGEARVAAGTWKVTRATVCRDLAAVNAVC